MAVTDDDVVAVFEEGWNAADGGAPADANPYNDDPSDDGKMRADLWERGWQAHADDPLQG